MTTTDARIYFGLRLFGIFSNFRFPDVSRCHASVITLESPACGCAEFLVALCRDFTISGGMRVFCSIRYRLEASCLARYVPPHPSVEVLMFLQ